MAIQDSQIAKVGKIILYRRGGEPIFLKWFLGRAGIEGCIQAHICQSF